MHKALLITNIKSLIQTVETTRLKICGKEMSSLNRTDNAFLLIENGLISDFGTMDLIRQGRHRYEDTGTVIINAAGKFVFPSFCDSHTHLV